MGRWERGRARLSAYKWSQDLGQHALGPRRPWLPLHTCAVAPHLPYVVMPVSRYLDSTPLGGAPQTALGRSQVGLPGDGQPVVDELPHLVLSTTCGRLHAYMPVPGTASTGLPPKL